MRIALAGNPNSGKTTMYNALTGRNEKVGNWAGVTVEAKMSPVRKSLCPDKMSIVAVDLPGAYSMSPFTGEESITRDYIIGEEPDVIINIVDSTNLSRSLFFTTQLLELGIPMVLALNKADLHQVKSTKIDGEMLSALLDCPVVETVSTGGEGLEKLVKTAVALAGGEQRTPYKQGEIDLQDKEAVKAADRRRFEFVKEIVAAVEKRGEKRHVRNVHDKVDAVLTHKVAGLVIFAAVMWLVFQLAQVWLGPLAADLLVGWIESFMELANGWMSGAAPVLRALLVDGIIGGVGAVVGFLPLVMVMYFLIALLEDCGYMARVSVMLDPIFKKVGLSGRSVIPFVMGVGCSIPGVMASRTVRNERERRATAMLTPFMPCGAKIPVISLFAGAFFGNSAWVSFFMYFCGIILIFLCALLINAITGNRAKKSYFIIEMPDYKAPSFKRAFLSMCSQGKAYIVKAATVILVCNTAVQLMQSFTWSFAVAESAEASILASIASPFAWLLVPVVGVLSWQMAAAAITGFIAKENVVGTLAVCFVGLENLINVDELAMLEGAGGEVAGVIAITKSAALAYLMFNLYTPPCFAAIGAMNSEMKSAKWLAGGIGLQLGTGFSVAFLVHQLGSLFATGSFAAGFAGGLVAVLIFAAILVFLIIRTNSLIRKGKIKV